jgi:hypothetical protein
MMRMANPGSSKAIVQQVYNRAFGYNEMSGFKNLLPVLLTLSMCARAQTVEPRKVWPNDQSSAALQVRVKGPVLWLEHCLSVRIDRINRTNAPLWLPNNGLYVDTSITELPDKKGRGDGAEWINVAGITDLIDFNAKPIAPGAILHKDICLPESVAVVNRSAKTRRQLELRGRLRIEAFFFLSEHDYLVNKAQHEANFKQPATVRIEDLLYPQVSTLEIAIPCRNAAPCSCDAPALLLYGEGRAIPDIYAHRSDWNEKGKKISKKLAHKQPPCSALTLNSQIGISTAENYFFTAVTGAGINCSNGTNSVG